MAVFPLVSRLLRGQRGCPEISGETHPHRGGRRLSNPGSSLLAGPRWGPHGAVIPSYSAHGARRARTGPDARSMPSHRLSPDGAATGPLGAISWAERVILERILTLPLDTRAGQDEVTGMRFVITTTAATAVLAPCAVLGVLPTVLTIGAVGAGWALIVWSVTR